MSAQHLEVFKAVLVLASGLAIFLVGLIPQSRFRAGYTQSGWKRAFLVAGGCVFVIGALYGLRQVL